MHGCTMVVCCWYIDCTCAMAFILPSQNLVNLVCNLPVLSVIGEGCQVISSFGENVQ